MYSPAGSGPASCSCWGTGYCELDAVPRLDLYCDCESLGLMLEGGECMPPLGIVALRLEPSASEEWYGDWFRAMFMLARSL